MTLAPQGLSSDDPWQEVAAIFFPTPGPSKIDPNLREAQQRLILEKYAPEIDVERFVSESPILAASGRGRKSAVLLIKKAVGGVLIVFAVGWCLFSIPPFLSGFLWPTDLRSLTYAFGQLLGAGIVWGLLFLVGRGGWRMLRN